MKMPGVLENINELTWSLLQLQDKVAPGGARRRGHLLHLLDDLLGGGGAHGGGRGRVVAAAGQVDGVGGVVALQVALEVVAPAVRFVAETT